MNKKRTLGTLLSLIAVVVIAAVFGGMTVMADEVVASGNCGSGNSDNLTWTITKTNEDTDKYLLTISGTGAMEDYAQGESPWYGFKNSIVSVSIQDGVTSIGDNAFYQCKEIPNVSFPSTLESIGDQAFRGCTALSYASIPASTIGEYAFSECGLTAFHLTGNITTINTGAFSYCEKLNQFYLSSTVERIGEGAFAGCGFTSISKYNFSEYVSSVGNYVSNVKYIDKNAFADCTNLTSITFPETVISIGESAFMNCGLASVTIPDGVKTIGTYAFYVCASLSTVNLPDSLTAIGASAFEGCGSLTEISIPKNVTSIGDSLFVQANSISDVYCLPDPANLTCSFDTLFSDSANVTIYVPGRYKDAYSAKFGNSINFVASSLASGQCGDNCNYLLDCDKVLVISGTGDMYDFDYATAPWYDNAFYIKEVIIEDGVTSIGNFAFYDFRNLTSVTIPESVKTIGEIAFNTCLALKSVVIPEGVTSIGRYAFGSCISLSSVTLPDSVTFIGDSAFGSCAFTEIHIPNNLTNIENNTFNYCSKLESVIIPDGVTVIGNYAFNDCSSLATITIPDSVTGIGSYAFSDCTALTSITIPAGVTEIKENTFFKCTSLVSADLPEGITTIGNDAFNACSSLSSVTIPDSVTSIGHGAFNGCAQIPSITLPEGLTEINSTTFALCSSLTSVNIPATVTSISFNAFKGCTSLAAITIPNGVTEIDNEAFSECDSLTTITIPGSVSSLGQKIFFGCDSLKTVTMLNGISFIGYAAFESCPELEKVIIPSTVTGIGQYAFNSDPELNDIYILANPSNLYWDFQYQDYPSTRKVHVPSGYVSAYETLFDDNGVNVTVIGDAENINIGSGTHLYGHSLSLGGNIGVKFYMTLADEVVASDTSYMQFTVNGRIQKIDVKDITPDAQGYYIFSCETTAMEMTDQITAQVYLADGIPSGTSYIYTVREYAEYILSHQDVYANEIDFVKAMLNYGAYAQKYFKHNTNNLANSILSASEQKVSIADPATINAGVYPEHLYIDGTNIRIAKVSLILKSTISMKLYITGADNSMTFKYDGKVLIPERIGNYYVVTIDNIPAQLVKYEFAVRVYIGDRVIGFVGYSPIDYCKNVLAKENDDMITTELKELISALNKFNDEAYSYIKPSNYN